MVIKSRLFVFSGDFPEIAVEEVLALSKTKNYSVYGKLMIADADFDFSRLALTRAVCDFLFECDLEDIDKAMSCFDWSSVYDDSFSVSLTNLSSAVFKKSEKDMADHIWRALKNPKVDLNAAKTKIEIFVVEKKAFVGIVVCVPRPDFYNRRPSVRPMQHPTMISPKLARACINLSGIKKGIVVDPFCGSGGILLEAGLIGLNTVGYDISDRMLKMAEKNLLFYGVSGFVLKRQDATELAEKVDYVVSDIPYGKCSAVSKPTIQLYSDFLSTLVRILRKKAVLIFPSTVDFEEILLKSKFVVEKHFKVYVHKSLTRHILVLGKSDSHL